MHLIDLPFDVLTQNGFRPIETLNCLTDRVAVCDNNNKFLTYQPVHGLMICPTFFEKSIFSNLDSTYSTITTTRSISNAILTSSNGIEDHAERTNSQSFLRNLKPKSNNYYDNEITNEFEIEVKDIYEALQIQKIAIHAGVIAEVFENNAEKRYTIKILDEHSSPTVEVQRVAGIGNFAASVLVEHMEKKKIVVRVKNNYCYKTYFV